MVVDMSEGNRSPTIQGSVAGIGLPKNVARSSPRLAPDETQRAIALATNVELIETNACLSEDGFKRAPWRGATHPYVSTSRESLHATLSYDVYVTASSHT